MGRPAYCVENFFSLRQFPNHVISANEEADGNEAVRVGSGRRRRALNSWTPTTTSQAASIKVACDRIRAANYIAIDGHNLGGVTVQVEVSSDDLSTLTEIFEVAIPTNVYPSMRFDDGALTEDGAYLRSFDTHAGKYFRLSIDDMGSGLKPQIAGLYLGFSFPPEHHSVYPFNFGNPDLLPRSSSTAALESRRGTVELKLDDVLEYEQARYHLEGLTYRGRPTWLVYDDEEAEKARLVRREGDASLQMEGDDWFGFRARFAYREMDPEVRS